MSREARAVARAVDLFAAMAHPVRLAALLALSRAGDLAVSELQEHLRVEQSALSHQLRILRDARLVVGERVGKQVRYRLADAHVAEVVANAFHHAAERR